MDLSQQSRQLLDLARDANSPPPRARHLGRQRLVGALAAGTLTTSAVVAKGAALGVTAAGTAGSSGVVGAATSLSATLVSAILIGFSTGLVVLSPATNRVDTAATSALAPRTNRSMVRQLAPAPQVPLSQLETAPPAQEPAAVAETVTRRVDAAAAVSAPSRPPKASIARETEILAEVQRAIKAGDPERALAALDRYNEECPAGQLQEEATASRVVALCGAGRVQDGRRWAAEFARRYPSSPLASRVSGACPEAPATKTP